MDVAICAIDKENSKLYFSGAKNGIYIVRKNELIELKGDKQSIGSETQIDNYTQHSFDLQKGDAIYLYSDGFADQFGGPQGKFAIEAAIVKAAETLGINPAEIQCIVGKGGLSFGSLQKPSLQQYADGVDTLSFLTGL